MKDRVQYWIMPAAGRPQGIAPTMLRSRLSSQINLAVGGAMTLHYTFYLILQQSPSEAKKEKKKLRGTPPSLSEVGFSCCRLGSGWRRALFSFVPLVALAFALFLFLLGLGLLAWR